MFGYGIDKKTLYIVAGILVIISLFSYGTDGIIDLLLSVPAVLIAITVHEFGHAFAAYKLGDDTPVRQGRLSLNPFDHIDPLGIAMLLFAHIGWGKPVEIDPRNYNRNISVEKADAIVSFAGPLMNFITALIFALIYCAIIKFAKIGVRKERTRGRVDKENTSPSSTRPLRSCQLKSRANGGTSLSQRILVLVFIVTALTRIAAGRRVTGRNRQLAPLFPNNLCIHHAAGSHLAATVTLHFGQETDTYPVNQRSAYLLSRRHPSFGRSSRIIEGTYAVYLHSTSLPHEITQYTSQVLHYRIRVTTGHGRENGQFICHFTGSNRLAPGY